MENKEFNVSTFVGILVVVVLGLAALWIAQVFLGLVWKYLWWIVGAAVAIVFVLLLVGATGTRRGH